MALSETAGELIDLMKSRNVDRDTCVGIVFTLKDNEENYAHLLKWIKQNPKAGQSEIMQQHYTYWPKVPYYIMPKNKRAFSQP